MIAMNLNIFVARLRAALAENNRAGVDRLLAEFRVNDEIAIRKGCGDSVAPAAWERV